MVHSRDALIPTEPVARLEVVFPARQMDELAEGLVAITEAIDTVNPDLVAHGCLGGQHGYGGAWDCDTFTMRPFYWGDCDCGAEERNEAFWSVNEHGPSCYQTELRAMECAAGVHYSQPDRLPYDECRRKQDAIYKSLCEKHGLTYPAFCAVHCTCGLDERAGAYFAENGHRPTCALELPNFLHKPTGLEVRWYKYIGRGQEVVARAEVDVPAILAECLTAVRKATPTPSQAQDGYGTAPAAEWTPND